MKKVINIEGRDIAFASNGATLILYKRKFGKQFFNELMKVAIIIGSEEMQLSESNVDLEKLADFDLEGLMDTFNEIAYICALSANNTIEDYEKWMEEFESPLSLFQHVNEILEVIMKDIAPTIQPKN